MNPDPFSKNLDLFIAAWFANSAGKLFGMKPFSAFKRD